MTNFPRIKVTTKVAKLYANLALRNKTHDGNYIIWMTDIDSVPGATLKERVEYVGGAMLTPLEAKAERNGTAATYAQVYTPVYLDKDAVQASETKAETEDDAETGTAKDNEQIVGSPYNPPVYAQDESEHSDNDTQEKED